MSDCQLGAEQACRARWGKENVSEENWIKAGLRTEGVQLCNRADLFLYQASCPRVVV